MDNKKPTPQINTTYKIADIELEINPNNKNNFNTLVPFSSDAVNETIIKQVAIGIKNNKPILLKGQTGVGKTSLIRHLANETNNTFLRVNLNGSTGTDEVVGRWLLNEKGTLWVDGPLLTAMREGHWLLVDEINAASPELDFIFHSLLDDDKFIRVVEKDGELVKPHPNFRFFAAMNPHESGYAGTKELNPAFVSRFPIVVDYSFVNANQELEIVKKHTDYVAEATSPEESVKRNGILMDVINFANELRGAYVKEELSFCCSTREVISFANLLSSGLPYDISLEASIINKANNDERDVIIKLAGTILDYKSTTPSRRSFSQKVKEFDEEKKAWDKEVGTFKKTIQDKDNLIKQRDQSINTLNTRQNGYVNDFRTLKDLFESTMMGKLNEDEKMFTEGVQKVVDVFRKNNI